MRSSRSDPPVDFADALDRVRPRLHGLASTVLFFPSVGSTNDVALKLAAQGDREGAIVMADAQTSGRGRRGRVWFSPPGSGLYISIVLSPGRARLDPDRATTLLTLTAGVALAEGIEAATGLRVDLKWPNDVYAGRRKLAGILAEAAAPHVVLGYGINAGSAAYPPELADRATSLETELGRRVDRAALGAETIAAVARRYRDLLDGQFDAILDAWRARAPGGRGARVEWSAPDGVCRGTTAGVDDRGALLVQVDDRIVRIVGGEVKWL